MTHRGYEQLDFLGTRSSFGGQRSIGGAAIVTDRESTRPKQQVGTDLARGVYGRALHCQEPRPFGQSECLLLWRCRHPELGRFSQRKLVGLMGSERVRRHPHHHD